MSSELVKADKNTPTLFDELKALLHYLPEHIRDKEVPEADRKLLEAQASRLFRGVSTATPLICQGEACPYAGTCTLYQLDYDVKGYRCPWEAAYADHVEALYLNDWDVRENTAEYLRVMELVAIELIIRRAMLSMSMDGKLHEDNIIGIDSDGVPVVRKELAIALQALEMASRRKDKFLREFKATRESSKGPSDEAKDAINRLWDAITKVQTVRDAGESNA